MQYSKQEILEIVNHQLLFWIKKDNAVKDAVFELIQTKHPTKKETDDKFEKMLILFRQELANDREVQEKKWKDNQKTISATLEELRANRKELLEEIKAGNRRHDQSMGAIGTRWGLHTEAAFRNALKGILHEFNSEYEVIHYNEFDDEGIVFDEPAPVEIDVLGKNGKVYLAEIKSSVGKDELYVFIRKRKFYEKKHNLKVYQMIVISPMIDNHAKQFAKEKGIKLYSYAEDVKL